MELRHLRYFLAVAEELHFRRAAERLHMSQPPLSQQIRALEEEIGVRLFDRGSRGVTLTPAGAAFRREAEAILAAVEHAVTLARRVDQGVEGELAVGFVGSTMYGVVPEILRRFRAERPGVLLRLRQIPTAAQVEELQAGRIDVGFLRPPVGHEGVELEAIDYETIHVVLPEHHPLAGREVITGIDLRGEPLVVLAHSEAPGLHDSLMVAMAQAGVAPRIAQEVTEIQTAIALVAAGVGISLVPSSVAASGRSGVAFVPLEGDARIELALAVAAGPRSPLVQTFLASAGARTLLEAPATA